METVTNSKCCARLLLAAWDSADPLQIQTAAARADRAAPAGSLESERIEMVRGAAGILRQWTIGSRQDADVNASLELLRHLAGPAFTATALLEMRACGRH